MNRANLSSRARRRKTDQTEAKTAKKVEEDIDEEGSGFNNEKTRQNRGRQRTPRSRAHRMMHFRRRRGGDIDSRSGRASVSTGVSCTSVNVDSDAELFNTLVLNNSNRKRRYRKRKESRKVWTSSESESDTETSEDSYTTDGESSVTSGQYQSSDQESYGTSSHNPGTDQDSSYTSEHQTVTDPESLYTNAQTTMTEQESFYTDFGNPLRDQNSYYITTAGSIAEVNYESSWTDSADSETSDSASSNSNASDSDTYESVHQTNVSSIITSSQSGNSYSETDGKSLTGLYQRHKSKSSRTTEDNGNSDSEESSCNSSISTEKGEGDIVSEKEIKENDEVSTTVEVTLSEGVVSVIELLGNEVKSCRNNYPKRDSSLEDTDCCISEKVRSIDHCDPVEPSKNHDKSAGPWPLGSTSQNTTSLHVTKKSNQGAEQKETETTKRDSVPSDDEQSVSSLSSRGVRLSKIFGSVPSARKAQDIVDSSHEKPTLSGSPSTSKVDIFDSSKTKQSTSGGTSDGHCQSTEKLQKPGKEEQHHGEKATKEQNYVVLANTKLTTAKTETLNQAHSTPNQDEKTVATCDTTKCVSLQSENDTKLEGYLESPPHLRLHIQSAKEFLASKLNKIGEPTLNLIMPVEPKKAIEKSNLLNFKRVRGSEQKLGHECPEPLPQTTTKTEELQSGDTNLECTSETQTSMPDQTKNEESFLPKISEVNTLHSSSESSTNFESEVAAFTENDPENYEVSISETGEEKAPMRAKLNTTSQQNNQSDTKKAEQDFQSEDMMTQKRNTKTETVLVTDTEVENPSKKRPNGSVSCEAKPEKSNALSTIEDIKVSCSDESHASDEIPGEKVDFSEQVKNSQNSCSIQADTISKDDASCSSASNDKPSNSNEERLLEENSEGVTANEDFKFLETSLVGNDTQLAGKCTQLEPTRQEQAGYNDNDDASFSSHDRLLENSHENEFRWISRRFEPIGLDENDAQLSQNADEPRVGASQSSFFYSFSDDTGDNGRNVSLPPSSFNGDAKAQREESTEFAGLSLVESNVCDQVMKGVETGMVMQAPNDIINGKPTFFSSTDDDSEGTYLSDTSDLQEMKLLPDDQKRGLQQSCSSDLENDQSELLLDYDEPDRSIMSGASGGLVTSMYKISVQDVSRSPDTANSACSDAVADKNDQEETDKTAEREFSALERKRIRMLFDNPLLISFLADNQSCPYDESPLYAIARNAKDNKMLSPEDAAVLEESIKDGVKFDMGGGKQERSCAMCDNFCADGPAGDFVHLLSQQELRDRLPSPTLKKKVKNMRMKMDCLNEANVAPPEPCRHQNNSSFDLRSILLGKSTTKHNNA